MITNRSLRFALCALLLLAPLATLAAQDADMMKDDGSFYISAAYGVALPGDREIDSAKVLTDLGFLGARSASATRYSGSARSFPPATGWPPSRTRRGRIPSPRWT